MVQITPLLSAISVLSQFTPPDSTSNGLTVRQTFDPSSLPSACQSPCTVVNTMTDCGASLGCICTNSIGSQLEQCMNCLISSSPSVESEAESAIDSWNQACDGNLSLSGSSSSSGTTGGSTTAGANPATTTSTSSSGGSSSTNPLGASVSGAAGLEIGGLAMSIVAALAGAFMSL